MALDGDVQSLVVRDYLTSRASVPHVAPCFLSPMTNADWSSKLC